MATRQEIQAALDIIRFTNVANDLFDVASQTASGNIKKPSGVVAVGQQPDMIAMTDDDIRQNVSRAMDNIQGYLNQINSYLQDQDKVTLMTNGLSALSVNLEDIQSDISGFQDQVASVKTSVADLSVPVATIAVNISQAVPSLKLVRNG